MFLFNFFAIFGLNFVPLKIVEKYGKKRNYISIYLQDLSVLRQGVEVQEGEKLTTCALGSARVILSPLFSSLVILTENQDISLDKCAS